MDAETKVDQQQDLLGETVVDSVSGMQADVEGYDSSTGMYRIRLESTAEDDPYETGHACWRRAYELTVVGAGAENDPQELAIAAENEYEIELLVRKGYAGLIAAALLGDEEATRQVRALLAGIGEG